MTMTAELLKETLAAIEAAGYETRSYSGRGMYGAKCLGVDCDNPVRAAFEIAEQLVNAELEAEDHETILGELCKAQTDSMGRGAILYFPGIAYEEGQSDGE